MGSESIAREKRRNILNEHSRVSCHQKEISFKLVFQFLFVWAETLHDNRTSYFQQSYVFWIFAFNGCWRENDFIRLTAKNSFRLMT